MEAGRSMHAGETPRSTTTRYPAEVIGSMLRPEELKHAFDGLMGAPLVSPPELKALEDRAVDEAIAIQERAGVDVVTDGEARRQSFIAAITETVVGVNRLSDEQVALSPEMHWHGTEGPHGFVVPIAITDRIRRARSLCMEEFTYARARAKRPLKVTLPSPLTLSSFWHPGVSDRVYSDAFDAFRDGAEVLRLEIAELVAIGCTYIQIDAPELVTHVVDPEQRAFWSSVGVEPERLIDEGVSLINDLAHGYPDVRFALHLCRGNMAGLWLAEGGYDSVARRIFPRLPNFDTFSLEYDTPRAGSFEPLRDVPDDKIVILGLVSTKSGEMESPEALSDRIDEAAQLFPREQLSLSTQCGFASTAHGNPISWEAQERKLAMVASVAHDALA